MWGVISCFCYKYGKKKKKTFGLKVFILNAIWYCGLDHRIEKNSGKTSEIWIKFVVYLIVLYQ